MKNWWSAAKANRLFWMVVIIAVAVIAIDQATKLWVLHGLDLDRDCQRNPDGTLLYCPYGKIELSSIFDLNYVENRGVSFGLLSGGIVSRVLLTVLALTVAGFVLHWAGRLNRKIASVAAGLIIGGAVGNAVDRAVYGYVVDFLDFSGIGFIWVFNLADTAINLGVACLAYDAFFVAPKAVKSASTGHSSSMATDEPIERKGDQPFPPADSTSIETENNGSRSSE